MMNSILYRVRLMALFLLAVGGSYGTSQAQEDYRMFEAKTPQLDPAYAKGVSGHIAGELRPGLLVMAGGCNFPDRPARKGGAKRYYSEIYIGEYLGAVHHACEAKASELDMGWKLVGHLPHPTAYAAFQLYDDQLIVAGGQSAAGDLSDAYIIQLSDSLDVEITPLPSLPEPRSGMASALIKNVLYLIGGHVNGKLSNTVLSLDLSSPQKEWREETPYPHSPFLKLVATTNLGEYSTPSYVPCLVVMGSFTGVDEPDQRVQADVTYMTYTPQTKQWQTYKIAPDDPIAAHGFGGGYAWRYEAIFSGGVRADLFVTALQREKDLKDAKAKDNRRLVKKLQAEQRAYLSHDPAWYGFCSEWYSFDRSRGRGEAKSGFHFDGRADAVYLDRFSSMMDGMLIGGETMPGVRTPSIVIFTTACDPPKFHVMIDPNYQQGNSGSPK
ncbi:cyclically-permuted mutarotase family protein [Porphyromonas sp. KLE 1280]|nr:cyclically-permuted mutarotase family protein [Porphyromonas sp. KLE 1280]